MNESRAQRKYMPYLVEFFALWYADKLECENKRQLLMQTLPNLETKKQQNTIDVLSYLAEAAEQNDEKYQAKIELAVQQLKLEENQAAQFMFKETQTLAKDRPMGLMIWMYGEARRWCDGEQPIDVRKRMENIIDYWRVQRSGDLENAARLLNELRLDFSDHGLHQLNIALLTEHLHAALKLLDHTLNLAKRTKNRQSEAPRLTIWQQRFMLAATCNSRSPFTRPSVMLQDDALSSWGTVYGVA